MAAVCLTCGLSDESCVCEGVAKATERVTIEIKERRYGRKVTVVKGLDAHEIDLKQLALAYTSLMARCLVVFHLCWVNSGRAREMFKLAL